MKPIVICRLPNHVGDCCMTLPALRLLDASGFTPYLVGKRFAEDLMLGMGWRFDPIEGHVTEDLSRLHYLSEQQHKPLGLLFPNSFGSALQFKLAGIRSAGFATDGRYLLLDKKIDEPEKNVHEVVRFFTVALGAIRAWGAKPAWIEPSKDLGLQLITRHTAGAKNLKEKRSEILKIRKCLPFLGTAAMLEQSTARGNRRAYSAACSAPSLPRLFTVLSSSFQKFSGRKGPAYRP